MDINIKINNEKKTYSFIDTWSDVTLDNLSRFLAYSKLNPTNRAVNTINLFSDMPKEIIKQLQLADVLELLRVITDLESDVDGTHKATFTLNGKRYGFIPSLEDITGA